MEIELTRLHAGQQAIVDSGARFKVVACGRRFGKTAIAIDMLCNRLLDGQSVAYFAPTYRMGAETWMEIRRLLAPLTEFSRERDWRMELYTGGVFECWSLADSSAETVRGRKYHFVVIDEAALLPSADIWHTAIRPLLTDYAGGALFASTPRGRAWFWQFYHRGQSERYPEWASWRFPTTENPFIDPTEVEAARRRMPERFFRQEMLAEFLDDGGVVFRNIERVCVGNPHPPTPSPLRKEGEETYETRCYFGGDWGKDNDFTCVSVMTGGGRQIHLERFNQIGWNVQRGRLVALYERFKPYTILAEENSIGSVNIEALRNEGLPVQGFTTTHKSKGPLIEGLVLAMEKEDIVLLNDETLKYELMSYEMKATKLGWTYSAPSGGHDDAVMATALSLYASRRYGPLLIGWV